MALVLHYFARQFGPAIELARKGGRFWRPSRASSDALRPGSRTGVIGL
jgi:hypothetical protein